MVKIYAPNKAYHGVSAGVQFTDGVGEVDKGNIGALRYFERTGYGIGKEPAHTTPAPEPWEGQVSHVTGGTPLRDASVAPLPDDFLPPTNAGEADPHGPLVVAPQVHGDGPAGIKPGDVHVTDTAQQNDDETLLAERVLVDRLPHGEANDVFAPSGSAPSGSAASDAPARNASQADWAAYAVAQGMDPDEAEEAQRKELIERYGGEG